MAQREASGSFRELRVWQEAFALTVAVRPVCDALQRSRRWHLADQLARAATSVHANIAEGDGRSTPRDRARLFLIARGSLLETESLLTEADIDPIIAPLTAPCFTRTRHTARLLAALLRSLQF